MNQRTILVVAAVIGVLFAGNAAKSEYIRIQDRLEKTQAKVDALTDELRATSQKLRSAIEAIAKRFAQPAQPVEAKQVQIKAEPIPTIIMHSADEENGVSCGPCRAWLATEKAKWQGAGWEVQVVKETSTKRGWPWYEITDRDGAKFEVNGTLTTEKFLAAKKAR